MNKRKRNTTVLTHNGQRLGDSFKNRTVVTHAEIEGQLLAICATGLYLKPFEARDAQGKVVFNGCTEIENKSIVTFKRGNVLSDAVASFDVESWEQIFDVKAACAPKGSIYDGSVVAGLQSEREKDFYSKLKTSEVYSFNGTPCLEWQGCKNHGYGVLGINKKIIRAHRLAYILAYGEIADENLFVCHRCDNRACCEPSHLFLGTAADNNRDMINKGRFVANYGKANGSAKLTSEIVQEIRKLGSENYTERQIAAKFSISPSFVHQLLVGKHWTDSDYQPLKKQAPAMETQSAPSVSPLESKALEAANGYESKLQFDMITAAREAIAKGDCHNIILRGLFKTEARLLVIAIGTPDRFTPVHAQDLRNIRKQIQNHWTRLMAREIVSANAALRLEEVAA